MKKAKKNNDVVRIGLKTLKEAVNAVRNSNISSAYFLQCQQGLINAARLAAPPLVDGQAADTIAPPAAGVDAEVDAEDEEGVALLLALRQDPLGRGNFRVRLAASLFPPLLFTLLQLSAPQGAGAPVIDRAPDGQAVQKRTRIAPAPLPLLPPPRDTRPVIHQADISDTKVPLDKQKPAILVRPVASRWGADFDMTRRVNRTELSFRMTLEKFHPAAGVTYTWIEPYLYVMEPVRVNTVKLQQERVPTLSKATFDVKSLFQKFRLIAEDPPSQAWLLQRGFLEVISLFPSFTLTY